jgi:hypothetical protein
LENLRMAKPAPASTPEPAPASPPLEIDLKDPITAALLAWLVPGLGHWYQGRRHKAVLFFVCILGTFIYGLYLGEGRVVYASWRPNDKRLPYLTQVAVGLAAMPAVVQALRGENRPIVLPLVKEEVDEHGNVRKQDNRALKNWSRLMAQPKLTPGNGGDSLDRLMYDLNRYWELGTYFTVIAGLLNILAIYDAWGGPAFSTPVPKKEDEGPPAG